MSEKDSIARKLALIHHHYEPSISRVVRLVDDQEEHGQGPVKLLEVNPDTPASGIVPIAFAADPPEIPYPSVVVEVTEAEYDQIKSGRLALPSGWRLGITLFPQG